MSEESESELSKAFSTETREYLVKLMKEAFKDASEIYRPESGHDRQFFGIAVYKTKVHLLAQYAENDPTVSAIHNGTSFSMQVGDFLLSTFSGTGEGEIEECYPNNKKRACRLADSNTKQLFLNINLPKLPSLNVYLMHRGDFETGLEDVFLGIPFINGREGRVNAWQETLSLWSKDSEANMMESDNAVLPPEHIEQAEVIFREPDQDADHSGIGAPVEAEAVGEVGLIADEANIKLKSNDE